MGDRPYSGRPGGGGPGGPRPGGGPGGPSGGGGGRGGGGRGGGGGGRGGANEGGAIQPADAIKQAKVLLDGMQLTAPKQMFKGGPGPYELALRPGFGKCGVPLKVLTNYYKVEAKANATKMAVHYDVDIIDVATEKAGKKVAPGDRGLPPKLGHAIIMKLSEMRKWPKGWGYDRRKNLYSPGRFLPTESSYDVPLPEEGDTKPGEKPRMRSFRVTIKEVALLNMSDIGTYIERARAVKSLKEAGEVALASEAYRDGMQALDTLLRWIGCNDPECLSVARSFYYYGGAKPNLGGGVQAWEGYCQAVKACQGGLMINVDATFTGMLRVAPLVELIGELLEARGPPTAALGREQIRRLKRHLRGVRVEITGGPYLVRKTIRNIPDNSADTLTFSNEKAGKAMNVAEYFATTGRKLKYPKLPCIDVSTVPGQPKYYPVELCKVTEGQRKAKLDAKQTAEMIKAAAQKPAQKKEYIDAIMAQLLPQAKPQLDAWGLEIKGQMQEVQARVLPAPPLAYGNTCYDSGREGSWNLRNTKFSECKRLDYWAVASLMKRQEAESQFPLSVFLQDQYQMLKSCGLQVSDKPPPVCYTDGVASVTQVLEQAVKVAKQANGGKPIQLILVLLPFKDTELYKQVKMFSDAFAGVPSQCFVAAKAGVGRTEPKGRPQYCANLALKINAKLDGINASFVSADRATPNHLIPILKMFDHVLVMGADVTHPSPAQRKEEGARSIAAVVGSKNRGATKFATRLQLQPPSDYEVITNLEVAVRGLLVQYYQNNGQAKPQAILFYRDGVAEGQFQEVLRAEFSAIKRACAALEEGYNPPVTFVVVQKRHNTRLLPVPGTLTHRSGNIVPGVVLDQVICSPLHYDFFLNSHAGLQGTNKPAHYHVLIDEIGCGADAMQLLTYWLCYTYCRATKAVSYCAPSYYAHLAAFRGRVLLGEPGDSSSEASGASSAPSFAGVHANIENIMYYA